jgi:peroxidase
MFAVHFGQFINHDFEDNSNVNFSSRAYFPLVAYLTDPTDPACLATTTPPPGPFRCNTTNTMLTGEARWSDGVYDNRGRFKVINNATSWLDLNTVYSHDRDTNEALRTLSGGRLRTSTVNITFQAVPAPGFPFKTFVFENTVATWNDTGVFNANPTLAGRPREWVWTSGDGRVNENAALMTQHLIWTREHNLNADAVLAAHPHWDPVEMDEEIFERARAITIAKYQKVIYEEYIPNEFGVHFTDLLGDYDFYRPNVNPNTRLAFASAAFRYGHVAMNSWYAIDQCGVNTQFGTSAPTAAKMPFLSMTANGPNSLTPPGVVGMAGSFENIVRGLIDQLAAPMDLGAPNDLRNLRLPTGVLDLINLDILRARHNQLPNYQKIRFTYYDITSGNSHKIYGTPGCPNHLKNNLNTADPLACFEVITGAGAPLAQTLKNLYNKVIHVDPFIGMLAEPHVPGTNFGRTTGNIIIDQYRAARDADRFFYERLLRIGYFSPAIANEIRGTTMATVLRRVFPGIVVPDAAFHKDTTYRTTLASSC